MSNIESKIGLGSAQWGLDYGIANDDGKSSSEEVARILAVAQSSNIILIDTAPLYGDAESKIGARSNSSFSIVTKTPHFPGEAITGESVNAMRASLRNSLRLLGQEKLYGCLVHNVDDILKPNGMAVLREMQLLKREGLVEKIGFSFYTADQMRRAIDMFMPDIVQLPFNVFDQRLIHDGSLALLKSMGVEIHARSALLQGLLVRSQDDLPKYFRPWKHLIAEWHSFCRSRSMLPAHAAIAFVCNVKEIDFCILGVEKSSQLSDVLDGLKSISDFDASSLSIADINLLNPTQWRLN